MEHAAADADAADLAMVAARGVELAPDRSEAAHEGEHEISPPSQQEAEPPAEGAATESHGGGDGAEAAEAALSAVAESTLVPMEDGRGDPMDGSSVGHAISHADAAWHAGASGAGEADGAGVEYDADDADDEMMV